MKAKIKTIPETQITGIMTIEPDAASKIGTLSIKVNPDGRLWIEIDGESVLRFKPLSKRMMQILTELK